MKPANIVLADGVERVKLTDFGLARAADDSTLTRTGIIAGTPQYMSPEQARGEAIDQRSDLFSLGSVMYAMCTGRVPFRAPSSYGVLRRIIDEEPRSIRDLNPDIPDWLCGIVATLMSKRPDDRFKSASEVADLLKECLAHVQQPGLIALPEAARPLAAALKPPSRTPVFRRLVGIALALALAAAGVLVVLRWDKGTLTIESQADDVAIQIKQGGKTVEELTVDRSGDSVRIAAGEYQIQLITKTDGLVVENGTFTLTRGGEHVATIKRAETAKQVVANPVPVPPAESFRTFFRNLAGLSTNDIEINRPGAADPPETPLWIELGVTTGPVSPLTAKVLEWIGLHLRPITRNEFREKNVFANIDAALDIGFVRTHCPAEKAGVHEVDILIGVQGLSVRSLKDLDSAIAQGLKEIQAKKTDSLLLTVLRNGQFVQIKVPFPVHELGLKTDEINSGKGSDPNADGQSPPKTSVSILQAVKEYNEQTADARAVLFDPPIPELTAEQLIDGIAKAATVYRDRKVARFEIAKILEQIVATGEFPDGVSLFVTGVEARDKTTGELSYRQIVPAVTLPPDSTHKDVVPFGAVGLHYSRDGKSTKYYGEFYNKPEEEDRTEAPPSTKEPSVPSSISPAAATAVAE